MLDSNSPTADNAALENISSQADVSNLRNQLFMELPVSLSVELGKSRLSLTEISNLSVDSVVKLDKPLSEPLNVLVNNTLVATAELVVVDNQYAARILELKS